LLFVDTNNVRDFRRCMAECPETLPSPNGSRLKISLAATLDLALFSLADGSAIEYLRQLKCPELRTVQRLLGSRRSYRSSAPFQHNRFEAFPIRCFEDLQSKEWVLFRGRFAQSANAGKKGDVFHGVSSVLSEMADNVVYHAGINGTRGCRGVAAYYITPRTASFSVADNGRGFLNSLRANPVWHDLSSNQEALKAVLLRHATSRAGENTGGGFTVLYNKLVSFNGTVFLRSSDCQATIKNTSSPINTLVLRLGEPSAGAQITVIIGKQGEPIEESLEENP
jgi:hypothetical protein